jgi:hypothetical protein
VVYFVVIVVYIFSRFGRLHQEKSGNPARHRPENSNPLWKKACEKISEPISSIQTIKI